MLWKETKQGSRRVADESRGQGGGSGRLRREIKWWVAKWNTRSMKFVRKQARRRYRSRLARVPALGTTVPRFGVVVAKEGGYLTANNHWT